MGKRLTTEEKMVRKVLEIFGIILEGTSDKEEQVALAKKAIRYLEYDIKIFEED
jgi:hypothetical protein